MGKEEFKFTVHEDVLVRSSKFFRAACNGGFKEAKEKIVRLPDLEVATFKTYIHWAYVGDIASSVVDAIEQDKDGQKRMMEAVKLYVAGDVLDDQQLRNASMDYLVEVSVTLKIFPGLEIVAEAWRNTTNTSLLQKALLDKYLSIGGKKNAAYFEREDSVLPREFLVDFFRARVSTDYGATAPWSAGPICRYHEHSEEVPWCEEV